MRSIRRNSLAAILENSDVIPHDLVVSKAWPATVFLERIDRIINDDKTQTDIRWIAISKSSSDNSHIKYPPTHIKTNLLDL